MLSITQLPRVQTPYYVYDTALLARTLKAIHAETRAHDNWHVHYAVKANAHPDILRQIAAAGFGADCVSGGEVQAALDAGFPASEIAYAGVGKADWEIRKALKADIAMFNVESLEELEVIHEIATLLNTRARVSFRINPDVGAHTHAHITTGKAENKFGIAKEDMVSVIRQAQAMPRIDFMGLHFHIGSQLLVMDDFAALCQRINELQDELEAAGLHAKNINVGGGLGVDYQDPEAHPIPDFKAYFQTYAQGLKLREGQQLHFELGRAVVAQMGSLITRCLYVKQAKVKKFAIVDAGMTDLIRPALYGAYHKVENLSAAARGDVETTLYDVVGPICESSDVFVRDYAMPATRRGDIIALRSAGAYGEIMASGYNCRPLPKGICIS
ncbi:MAG: diaminopimelate decarboxylase [Bacteroidaceae bacterium]|nr:diaminopimelate decarboxylase [Bacteroidaceae bacterium]